MMKTSILVNIILLSFCFITISCHNTKDKNEGIQLKLSLEQDITFLSADSILGEKRIVPLETTDKNIISCIDKLEIYNDRFYILDGTQDIIFIFDKFGRYLSKIAHFGRGAEEYLHISDFHIDDHMIYVLAGINRKIMCYDPDGKWLKSFPTTYGGDNITTDSSYVYINYNFNNPQGYNVGVYSKKDYSLVKQYKSYPKQQEGVAYGHKAWTTYNNQVYASFYYEYNIYRLTPDTCTVFASLDCGADKMYPSNWNTFSPQQKEEYDKQKGGIIDLPLVSSIKSIFFTSRYMIFTFIYTSLEYTVMLEHLTQQVRYGVLKPTTYYWNIMRDKIYVSDEYMVLSENPSNIISYRSKVPSAKEEWALNLQEDDNPCLYFYKLKP
ncbi:MAG: 6-bladed beta-propeller [Odoribacter sp.]|nr:6-bladed beta-propeller [Odoribacter sp.]